MFMKDFLTGKEKIQRIMKKDLSRIPKDLK